MEKKPRYIGNCFKMLFLSSQSMKIHGGKASLILNFCHVCSTSDFSRNCKRLSNYPIYFPYSYMLFFKAALHMFLQFRFYFGLLICRGLLSLLWETVFHANRLNFCKYILLSGNILFFKLLLTVLQLHIYTLLRELTIPSFLCIASRNLIDPDSSRVSVQ